MSKYLVCGAGGFIGGHLVDSLMKEGHEVICADIKPLEYWFQLFDKNKNAKKNERNQVYHEQVKIIACLKLWDHSKVVDFELLIWVISLKVRQTSKTSDS